MWMSNGQSARRIEFFCPAEGMQGQTQDQQSETVKDNSAFVMEPAVKESRINMY